MPGKRSLYLVADTLSICADGDLCIVKDGNNRHVRTVSYQRLEQPGGIGGSARTRVILGIGKYHRFVRKIIHCMQYGFIQTP